MEFVQDAEVLGLLKDLGVIPQQVDDQRMYLEMRADDDVVRLHLAGPSTESTPDEGARVISVDVTALPKAIDGIIHKLHLSQVLLVPVAKWRHLFDCVAFSLAENEDWQEVDAAATVELNSRDPLLCEPGEYHTVSALLTALLENADSPEQGVMLTSTSAPVLVEVVPDGAVRMSFGNQVLADEATEAIEAIEA